MKDTVVLPNNKEFFEIQSAEFQFMYSVYSEHLDSCSSPAAMRSVLAASLESEYGFTPEAAKEAAAKLYEQFSKPTLVDSLITTPPAKTPPGSVSPQKPKITISLEDYQKFLEMVQCDSEATPQIKALLLSFIIFYRKNYHPTGWVRYDKKNIFYLAGISSISSAKQEKLTSYLHTHYDLNMQVIGSNQPIPCYNLSWIQSQSTPGSQNNPMITLGDLTPETVRSIVSKLV